MLLPASGEALGGRDREGVEEATGQTWAVFNEMAVIHNMIQSRTASGMPPARDRLWKPLFDTLMIGSVPFSVDGLGVVAYG